MDYCKRQADLGSTLSDTELPRSISPDCSISPQYNANNNLEKDWGTVHFLDLLLFLQGSQLDASDHLQLAFVDLLVEVFDVTASWPAHATPEGLQLIELIHILLLLIDVIFKVRSTLLKRPESKALHRLAVLVDLYAADSDDDEVLQEALKGDEAGLQVHPWILDLDNEYQTELEICCHQDQKEPQKA